MDCKDIYTDISKYMFKIETPFCSGTGFLCYKNDYFYAIATAYHVIDSAYIQQTPIKITHYGTNNGSWFLPGIPIIACNKDTDSAVIILPTQYVPFLGICEELPKFFPTGFSQAIGSKVCWLGFPKIQSDTLCIFSGIISARINKDGNMYLVDGVSIHGVSGGPIITIGENGDYLIIGIVNQYIPNIIKVNTDISLPGLIYARDVSHFIKVIHDITSLDELNTKKEEIELNL